MIVYHIANTDAWNKSQNFDDYAPDNYSADGFIHCSKKDQLFGVAQRYYFKIIDVVILAIETDLLSTKWIMENTDGGTELFPHIYGKITHSAIQEVLHLDWKDDKPVIPGLD